MNDIINSNKVMSKLQSIQDILDWTVSIFNESDIYYGHGTDNALDEAIRLVLPTIYLPLNFPQNRYLAAKLTDVQRQRIINRVMLRVKERIPVAYITNKAWFCNYEFYIDERVLIPRSPISELIENQFVSLITTNKPKYILDIGTGSGCIAIACSYFFPNAIIHAVDISKDALAVTEYNINIHHRQKFITSYCSNLFEKISNKYDLIISNPPYVGENQIKHLPPEYDFEPKLGLIAGMEGLEIIHRILLQASDYLNNNGILICEVGYHENHLIEKYPKIPFLWLEFERGGNGVFMLTKKQLITSKKYVHPVSNLKEL
ncbi:MAG: 50S ribosomal protein L3 N(5)-glutamine methyltransferase [Candidatus Dasytiphilus stammeri]